jgi:hypothetical protein
MSVVTRLAALQDSAAAPVFRRDFETLRVESTKNRHRSVAPQLLNSVQRLSPINAQLHGVDSPIAAGAAGAVIGRLAGAGTSHSN